MNKTSPKKIMEIIFIFILPLLLIMANITYRKLESEDSQEITIVYTEQSWFLEYDNFLSNDSPIQEVLEIPMELLGLDTQQNLAKMIIDYNVLWFINFIAWHLLYLFFDTIMHKVLLRKE